MYCNRCGAHIPEDADFCPQCGCRVSGKAAQAQMQEGIPIRRAHRSNSVIIGAILAVAIVLIVCIICLTVVTRASPSRYSSRHKKQLRRTAGKQRKANKQKRRKHRLILK